MLQKLSARSIENLKKGKQNHLLLIKYFLMYKEIERKLGLKVSIVNKKNNSGGIVEYKDLEQFELIQKLLKN